MKKRPLGFIGAIFFITMIILSRFGFEKSLYILPVFIIAVFFVFLKQRNLQFFTVFISSVLCACLIFYVASINFATKEQYFSGENVEVEGVLYEEPYFNGEYVLYIKTDKVDSKDVSMKIRVNSLTLPQNATLYNKVKLKANLYSVSSLGSDASSSYKADKITHIGSCVNNSLEAYENENKPFEYYLISIKYKFIDTIYNLLPNDVGGFIIGSVFGNKDFMSKNLIGEFKISGVSHILVVSGLHMSIWAGFIYIIFKRLLGVKLSSLVSIGFIVLFMAFTGFTPSVIRAGVMTSFLFISKLLGEKIDSLNTLGISALILTIFDPFSVYNVGTVFSFASVYGIILMDIYVRPKIDSKLLSIKSSFIRKIIRFILTAVLVALSAQIFTFPVSVLYGIKFSFLSIVANTCISAFTTTAMVCGGFGSVLLYFLPDFIISKMIFGISIIFSKIIILIVHKLSAYEELYMNVSVMENYLLLLIVLIVLTLLVFVNMNTKRKVMIFSLFLTPIILVSNLIPAIYRSAYVEFAVINVGKGLCVTFTNGNETVMFGCGGKKYSLNEISKYLSERKVNNIKALYLPVDNNVTYTNNARVLSKEINVESVVTSADYKFSYLSENVTSADIITATYFNGKLKIDYFTEKNCAYALATVGDKRILINFYGNLKTESLPQCCINPDIYVTMYSNTFKTEFHASQEYIISNEYSVSVPASVKNLHYTANDDTYIKAIKV